MQTVEKGVRSLRDWKAKRRRLRLPLDIEVPPPNPQWPDASENQDNTASDSTWPIVPEFKASAELPKPAETVIPCRVVLFDETDEAECSMIAGGYELPRVGFPAAVLRAVGLAVGDHFLWTVRDPDNVRLADVAFVPPPSLAMTPEKEAELERLYAEFERGVAEDGGDWPVTTGDGK